MMKVYSQPEFYHFSEVSVLLAKFASKAISQDLTLSVLDLCAGCGVVGIEFFLSRESKDCSLTLLELQEEFFPHIKKNLLNAKLNERSKTLKLNFLNINQIFLEKYDLILCNPPYFSLNKSRPSFHKKRDLCQRQHGFSIQDLLNFVCDHLKDNGSFFLSYHLDLDMSLDFLQSFNIQKKEKLGFHKEEYLFHLKKIM